MAIKKKVVKEKTQLDYFKSIDLSLKTLNDFLQGEFFEKIESLDWKVWELHNRAEKNEKVIGILEDVK